MLQLFRRATDLRRFFTCGNEESKEHNASGSTRASSHPLGLPPELWLLVGDFLPLEAQAALAFTCYSMAQTLGGKSWAQLRHDVDSKLAFLRLLNDTFPGHWLCYRCAKYRARVNERDTRAGREHPCHHTCWGTNGCTSLVPALARLEFADVHLEMRAHRLGPQFGLKVPSFDRLQRHSTPPGYTYSLDTAVVGGRLLLCLSSATSLTEVEGFNEYHLRRHMGVCYHFEGEIMDLCHCVLSHNANPDGLIQCSECLPLRRCHSCASEYLLRGERIFPSGCRLTLYRWSDMGDGLDPSSREWTAASTIWAVSGSKNKVFGLNGLPSVCKRFESSLDRCAPDYRPEPWRYSRNAGDSLFNRPWRARYHKWVPTEPRTSITISSSTQHTYYHL